MPSYVDSIRADADALSAVVRTTDLATAVPSCPGWDLRKLVTHTGRVHRWATVALKTGAPPARELDFSPPEDANLAVWIVDGAAELTAALDACEPGSNTWHPFPLAQRAWVWARRQALETAMHRWDAQHAAGIGATVDAEIASEGIGEYLDLGIPRILEREQLDAPNCSLHIHCTDTDGEWLVWNDHGSYRMLPVHEKGDAAIRGTAGDIWLLLMGRADIEAVDIVGDPAAAEQWLGLPGW